MQLTKRVKCVWKCIEVTKVDLKVVRMRKFSKKIETRIKVHFKKTVHKFLFQGWYMLSGFKDSQL